MIDTEPSVKDMAKLWNVVAKFIEEQHLSCAETTAEDRVYENAPELVYDMCEIVGYYDYPEDEE